MMRKLIVLLTIFSFNLQAQSPIVKAYIEEGLESNLALKQQNLEIEKSIKAIDIARSNIFPKIAFKPTYTLATGGRSIEFPIGDLLNPVYGTLNQLTESNNFPTLENQTILFAPNNFHETKVTFELPLFNSDIKYNVLLQRDLVETQQAKKKALSYELKYNIEAAYYQYLQSLEALKIYQQSGAFLNDFLDFNERLVANGLALKDALFSAKYEISKLDGQRSEAEKNVKKAKAYFNFLLNKGYDEQVEIDTTIFSSQPLVQELSSLTTSAMNNRPEFDQLRTGLNANNTLLQLQEKNAILPSLYFGGSTGFQGYGYSFNKQAFAIGQLGLTWDLYHGKEKKHKIQQTEIQSRILDTKMEEAKQQIEMQVVQAYFDFEASLKALESSKLGVQNTSSLLDMVQKRYKNKDALYIEVIKAQNDKMLAELQASLAQFNIWLQKSHLDKVGAQ